MVVAAIQHLMGWIQRKNNDKLRTDACLVPMGHAQPYPRKPQWESRACCKERGTTTWPWEDHRPWEDHWPWRWGHQGALSKPGPRALGGLGYHVATLVNTVLVQEGCLEPQPSHTQREELTLTSHSGSGRVMHNNCCNVCNVDRQHVFITGPLWRPV